MKALNACRFALVAVLSAAWLATPATAQAINIEDIEALVVALETGEYESEEMAAQVEAVKKLQESTGMTIGEIVLLLQQLPLEELDGFATDYLQSAAEEGMFGVPGSAAEEPDGEQGPEELAIDSLIEMPVPSLVQGELVGSGTGSELEP